MASQRRVLKWLIFVILGIFLLATGLTSVLYLASDKQTAEGDVGADSLSGTDFVVDELVVEDEPLPTMTKEEAQKQLQELLSGNKK